MFLSSGLAPLLIAVSVRALAGAAPQDPSVHKIADFETDGAANVRAQNGKAEVVEPGGEAGASKRLAWSIDPGQDFCSLTFTSVPEDVTPFRTLRMKVAAKGTLPRQISVRIESGAEDYLHFELPAPGASMTVVEVALPKMAIHGKFDPKAVKTLLLAGFETKAAVLTLDDVELVRAPGGWRFTDKELLNDLFGKERVEKSVKIETKHFKIFTDSTGAQSKFPAGLEKTYEFVHKELGGGALDPKLPVYIFQSSNLYYDFCVRHGWTRAAAEQSAGHGSGDYFAASYQSPEAPVVTHELTHSIFHRTFGAGGGSWFQEGVAVYIENLYQKRSVAFAFSGRMRAGQILALEKFVAVPTLISERDPKGGAGVSGALYEQAGAFVEFIRRGPYGDGFVDKLQQFANGSNDPAKGKALLEATLGAGIEEIETKWKAWGAKPPQLKG